MTEQRVVRFEGRVQGVGFRFTACRVAAGYDVTGYVKNLPNGSVECVLEGEKPQIDACLDELADRMGRHIHRFAQQTAPVSGRWTAFGVEF
jgi:acylphosphatase